jgi:hypothetical protein
MDGIRMNAGEDVGGTEDLAVGRIHPVHGRWRATHFVSALDLLEEVDGRRIAAGCDPSGVGGLGLRLTGGVAALNHRLPRCDPYGIGKGG